MQIFKADGHHFGACLQSSFFKLRVTFPTPATSVTSFDISYICEISNELADVADIGNITCIFTVLVLSASFEAWTVAVNWTGFPISTITNRFQANCAKSRYEELKCLRRLKTLKRPSSVNSSVQLMAPKWISYLTISKTLTLAQFATFWIHWLLSSVDVDTTGGQRCSNLRITRRSS